MTRRLLGSTAVVLLSLILPVRPASAAQGSQPPPSTGGSSAAPPVDVSRLPLNLNRIQRQLRQTTVREERDGLNLRYVVDVFGQAPRIELFTKEDVLENRSVPWGAPTHQDMMQVVTPQEYRAPAASFSNLLNWFNKSKK